MSEVVKRFIYMILFLPYILLTNCGDHYRKYEETRFMMGTYLKIVVYGEDEERLKKDVDEAFELAKRLDRKFSVFDGEISVINRNGGGKIDGDIKYLLKVSKEINRITQGHFDITVYPLLKLWGFTDENYRVPSEKEIERAIKNVDMKRLRIKDDLLSLNGAEIDLSSLSKGYIVDRVVEFLKERSIRTGLVDGGGDIRVWGRRKNKRFYRIGIKHPRESGIIEVIELNNESVATSGDYENYFIKEGIRYHHLIDARTGYPVRNFMSVTVVDTSACAADAWSTALFVSGNEGIEIAERYGIKSIFIYSEDGEIKIKKIGW